MRLVEFRFFNVYRLASLIEEGELLRFSFDKEKLLFKNVDKNNLYHITLTRNEEVKDRFNKYLNGGERGYYVYWEDKVISCGWVYINSKSSKTKNKYIVIPKGFAWLHDFWTHPEFRGRGIYPALLQFICKEILSKRLVLLPSNILIDTDCSNTASNRGIQKAGFEFIGNIVALRIRRFWVVLRETYGAKIFN